MDRLDRRSDPEPAEPGDVGRVDELDVLDPRLEAGSAGGRTEDVEGDPDRGVADRVDLRRDPGSRRLGDERRELLGRRREEPALWILRSGRARLPRLEQRRRPRTEGSIGERLEPPETQASLWVVAEAIAASIAVIDRRIE